MDIKIDYNNKENYDTHLNDILINVNENLFKYHNEHRLAAPISIYNKAIEKIVEAYEDLLEYSNFKFDLDDEIKWKKTNKKHKDLLEAVIGYIDVIYDIMKCFFPKNTVKKHIEFSDKWMMQADKKNTLEFKKKIKEYRTLMANINNKVKHANGEYAIINCSPRYRRNISRRCMGYYILGRDESGAIEPDYKIHPLWKNKHIGISYNKDLRDIIANIYFISYYAAKAIKDIVKDKYKSEIDIINHESKFGDRLYKVIKKVNELDSVFFPNEYGKNMPEICIYDKVIEFHKPCRKNYFKKIPSFKCYNIEFTCNLEDSNKFKLLYYNRLENEDNI
ncbi:hypothetical protein FHH43_14595 [Clostridium perfringens]|nr:hypothetical protein [Clostridium perfringens]